MSDIEKLIERLEYISEPSPYRRARNGVVSALLKEAAAMLRKVEAQRKELELELWKWPALMNEVRAELKCTQAERQRAQEACEQISAKLERAREALQRISEYTYSPTTEIARATLEELK